MAYATVADVLARLGRFSAVVAASGSSQHPNEDDVDSILEDVAAEIDLALLARGYSTDALDQRARAGLVDLTAFGAIGRLLAGVPADADLDKVSEFAWRVWRSAMGDPAATQASAIAGSIRSGAHPVVAALEAGASSGGPGSSAGDFFDEESDYGTLPWIRAQNAAIASGSVAVGQLPQFYKGMSG